MDRPARSLKLELHQTPSHPATELDCALQRRESCCDGIGYRLQPRGSLTHAELCNCVKECASCFGQNRRLIDGAARTCRSPAPSRVVTLINNAALPARYSTARLDSFSNFTGNGRDIVQRVSHWKDDFNLEKPRGLILGGPVGVGKTYLLAALAKSFAAKGVSVRFADFFQLLLALKAGYTEDKNESGLLNEMIEVDVLMIDELGKGRCSDWELSVLDQLVMGRYNRNKIIVASTNYSLKPLTRVQTHNISLDGTGNGSTFDLDSSESLEKRITSRVYSRLCETADFAELKGEDFRRMTTQEKTQQLRPSPASRRPN